MSTPENDPIARNGAVDAIKGIAIVSVLLLHSLAQPVLRQTFSYFHVSQAVPVLVMMMGYTGVMTRVTPLRDYFGRRAVRLLVPWAVAWIVGLGFLIIKGDTLWRPTLLLGALPVNGPGNYFITIAIEFIFVLPVLRWLLDRGPWVLLGTCLALDVAFQLLAGHFDLNIYLFKVSILRYLFAIGLGMFLASGHTVWPLLPFSFAYLVAVTAGVPVTFLRGWQSQAFFAAGYPAALVSAGLRFDYPRLLQSLGRASWHIFLVQVLWFGQVAPTLTRRLGLQTGLDVALDVTACLVLGIAFARTEAWVSGAVRRRWAARRAVSAG